MTSTYLNYRVYSNSLSKTLSQVAAEPSNSSAQTYFEANIGKVKSVDDFLNNYKLFTYAMKAYGLSDLGNAQALMKKVLESDLTDKNSFANRLNDVRYKNFAKAFNFTATGGVSSSGVTQTASQQQNLFKRMGATATQQTSLSTEISGITSVAAFEADDDLYTSVIQAYGLTDVSNGGTTTKAQVAAALESNLSNPYSAANRPDYGTNTTQAKLRAMAADFNFTSDGTVGGQTQLQSAQSIYSTQTAYLATIPANADAKTTAAAQAESAYYAKTLPTLTSVDQIAGDSRLVSFIKTAFGLNTNIQSSQIKQFLTSNLLDPKSVANTFNSNSTTTSPTPFQKLALAFNVGTDGTAWDHSSTLSAASLRSITSAYTKATTAAAGTDAAAITAAKTAATTETDYFTKQVKTVTSVSALLSDNRLLAYVRTAFNLPAPVTASDGTTTQAGLSVADLTAILQSDIANANSAANTKGTSAFNLATSFNFAPDGLVYAQRTIQSAADITATTSAYQTNATAASGGATSTATAKAKTETAYYTATISRLKSVDDILSNKRIVAYLTTAYNLPTTSTADLKKVLTSNLQDPKSKANTLGAGYQTLAGAFNILADGTISSTPARQVQSKSGIVATHAAYLEQTMESEAGDQYGDGVRLALYFRNVAPTITSVYGILADKALTKVVQTMLGLTADSSSADIDSQATYIKSKLKISDFKDPAKLDKLISRFTSLYDLANPDTTSTDTVSALFGGSDS